MKEILIIAALFLVATSTQDNEIASARHPGVALYTQGEKVFKRKCKTCHTAKEGKNKVGPSLYGLFGREVGTLEGYKYSKAMKKMEFVWDDRLLNIFMAKPKLMIPKTKMNFRGIRNEEDRKALIEYLKQFTIRDRDG